MSFFGGSGRKKKFQNDDNEGVENLEVNEEESRESWGTSKKSRKASSYFSHFESENDSVEFNTDRDSYASNDQIDRRIDSRHRVDDRHEESYSKSSSRNSREAYESTDSEFEMARANHTQVEEFLKPAQIKQSNPSNSRNLSNRTVSVTSGNRHEYEKTNLIGELEGMNAPAQFNQDHTSTFSEVSAEKTTASEQGPTNMLQDDGLIDRNGRTSMSNPSNPTHQQLNSSVARVMRQELNQTKSAHSTTTPIRGQANIHPIQSSANSKYLQPFARSTTCLLKPAVLFTRESTKRPITSISRPTGASDASQRSLASSSSSPRKSPREEVGPAPFNRDVNRQQSPTLATSSSTRPPKEITPEKQLEDNSQQEQQHRRLQARRQFEYPNSHNDCSSPQLSALSTPKESQSQRFFSFSHVFLLYIYFFSFFSVSNAVTSRIVLALVLTTTFPRIWTLLYRWRGI